ncbi:MAG: hypothetical protein R3E67_06530 [Pseudomonadales bacterium]
MIFRSVLAAYRSDRRHSSHEFRVLAELVKMLSLYDGSDYAANIEKAEAPAPTGHRPAATQVLACGGYV